MLVYYTINKQKIRKRRMRTLGGEERMKHIIHSPWEDEEDYEDIADWETAWEEAFKRGYEDADGYNDREYDDLDWEFEEAG